MELEEAYTIINNTLQLLLKLGKGEVEEIPHPQKPEEKIKGHSCFLLEDFFPNLEEAINLVSADMNALRKNNVND